MTDLAEKRELWLERFTWCRCPQCRLLAAEALGQKWAEEAVAEIRRRIEAMKPLVRRRRSTHAGDARLGQPIPGNAPGRASASPAPPKHAGAGTSRPRRAP